MIGQPDLAQIQLSTHLELDTFNHEISSSEAKAVQCSTVMVGIINILQHSKCLFSTIALASRALNGMNMVF